MNITAEQADDKVLISLNPEIDPELRKYSEDALAKTNEDLKYMPLKVWDVAALSTTKANIRSILNTTMTTSAGLQTRRVFVKN
jgi:hypothetical protein